MDSGLYAAYTGLLARTQALDTAANNLANAGTNGFRSQRDVFRDVLAGQDAADSPSASQLGRAVNDFGVLSGSSLDLGQGQISQTGNPTDLALDGAGFFAMQTAGGVRYTRDGGFQRSDAGALQTSTGNAVLDTKGQPITLPNGEVSISGDGSISVNGAIVAQVGVFQFPQGTELTAEGSNRFAAPQGVLPTAGTGTVHQGSLEGANEDAAHGTLQLILVQRQAEMMQKALSVFNNDFDKTAAEDLGRV